jgi:hypothetical protein
MIIFNLDGTLADCEHRRHYVDPEKNENFARWNGKDFRGFKNGQFDLEKKWEPDWKSFYKECDKDKIISQTRSIFDFIGMNGQSHKLQIWSARCESTLEKTKEWLRKYLFAYACHEFDIILKMRPIGDSTLDDVLKESWLDQAISEGKVIDFVFDDHPKVVQMWRRRGIFVFNCNQSDQEF